MIEVLIKSDDQDGEEFRFGGIAEAVEDRNILPVVRDEIYLLRQDMNNFFTITTITTCASYVWTTRA